MREKAPPPRPTHRVWSWSGVVLSLALLTSLAWYMFWVVMASIELDIKHIVNWYFFARFNLTKVPHTYEGLESVGYWTPLFVFAIFLASCLVCPCRTYMGKVPPVRTPSAYHSTHSLTPSLTPLTHSLPHSLTHSLTLSLPHSLSPPPPPLPPSRWSTQL